RCYSSGGEPYESSFRVKVRFTTSGQDSVSHPRDLFRCDVDKDGHPANPCADDLNRVISRSGQSGREREVDGFRCVACSDAGAAPIERRGVEHLSGRASETDDWKVLITLSVIAVIRSGVLPIQLRPAEQEYATSRIRDVRDGGTQGHVRRSVRGIHPQLPAAIDDEHLPGRQTENTSHKRRHIR